MADLEDLDLDEGLDDEAGDGSGDEQVDETETPAPQDTGGDEKPKAGTDKRISDLQSRADVETARANRAEAELRRLRGERGSTAESAADGETGEFLSALRDSTRETIFAQDPRLARYKVQPSEITGNTPAEMRASFDALRSRIDSMESAVRAEVQREFGIEPSIVPGRANALPKFGEMSDEDFAKFLDQRDRNPSR